MSSKELHSINDAGLSIRSVMVGFAVVISCGMTGCALAPAKPNAAPAVTPVLGTTSADDARKQAAEALAKGDSELALRLYVEAADRDPTDADSFYEIGALYDERHDPALAARAYARAVQIDPQHVRALAGLGLDYFEDHQFEPAREFLTRAIAVDPKQWRCQNALGLIADASGDHETAVKSYAAALAVHPGSAVVLNNRGYSSYLAGDLKAAEADFRAAIAADSGYQRAWQNLGLIYARRGDYDNALATLGRVVSGYVAANDVGYIAMLSGDYATAERLFDDAIRLSPRYYATANENVAELERRRATSGGGGAVPQ